MKNFFATFDSLIVIKICPDAYYADQAILVLTTTTTTTTDGQNDCFTPCCACTRGVIMCVIYNELLKTTCAYCVYTVTTKTSEMTVLPKTICYVLRIQWQIKEGTVNGGARGSEGGRVHNYTHETPSQREMVPQLPIQHLMHSHIPSQTLYNIRLSLHS